MVRLPQVALPLGRLLGEDVATVGVAGLVLAGGGLAETLGCRPVGLDLGHCDVLVGNCHWHGRRHGDALSILAHAGLKAASLPGKAAAGPAAVASHPANRSRALCLLALCLAIQQVRPAPGRPETAKGAPGDALPAGRAWGPVPGITSSSARSS